METKYKYPPTTEDIEALWYGTPEEERPLLLWSVTRAGQCFRAELEGTLTPDQAEFLKAFRQVGDAAHESVRALYKADLLGWQVVK